jgi:hypothetical protein
MMTRTTIGELCCAVGAHGQVLTARVIADA